MEGQVDLCIGKQGKVAAFMEIVGESADRAEQFLQVYCVLMFSRKLSAHAASFSAEGPIRGQATSWQLEEAIQLYFAGVNEIGVGSFSSPTATPDDTTAVCPAATFAPELSVASNPSSDCLGFQSEDYVRPPLPVRREALYDDISQFRGHFGGQIVNQAGVVDAFRNFEDEATQRSRWRAEANDDIMSPAAVKDSLAAMYRPPFFLMFLGTFEQAKAEAARQEKWLLVNLQSTKEFSSYMLNRDTWSHEAVKDTVGISFVFWQVYNDTGEGRKVCTFYNLANMPTTLVLDPITGQKMWSWAGMISPDRLLEDLVPFMDKGPSDKRGPCIPPQKQSRESVDPLATTSSEPDRSHQEVGDLRCILAAALDRGIPSRGTEVPIPGGKQKNVEPVNSTLNGEASAKLPCPSSFRKFCNFPEEPPPESTAVCKIAFRLPDGRRSQRRFLLSDPIKYLWSYCSTEVHESGGRPFRLTHTIPGSCDVFVQDSDMSILEAGVANTMLVMTWL